VERNGTNQKCLELRDSFSVVNLMALGLVRPKNAKFEPLDYGLLTGGILELE